MQQKNKLIFKKNTSNTGLRLFFAIFPPKSYFEYFKNVLDIFNKEQRNLKNVSFEDMHLTLKFVGASVSPESMNLLISEVRSRINLFVPPRIEIKSIRFGFKDQTYPDILIAEVIPNRELKDLSDALHEIVKLVGAEDTVRWKNKYFNNFHITMARLKKNMSYTVAKRIQNIAVYTSKISLPQGFVPKSFELVDSVLRNSRNNYKIVHSFRFCE